ncbi:SPARC [Petromyzon marinus]|uniref:SPARC n=1 Tax=Petromyzon marinus TaxID=7757 RepID=A1YIY4_PETMA|nr:SPARC [Petromyzon marinus]XP_032800534.1 SPARC [Petromyzon marinus]ABM21522.1 SPARCA [Petromyzon marinus]
MKLWIILCMGLVGTALALPESYLESALEADGEVVEELPMEGGNPVQGEEEVEFEDESWAEGKEETRDDASGPCGSYHCKEGKVCEVDETNQPMCICQDPSTCPKALNDFEKVCGTDNATYGSSCHFHAHKCTLEGTKKGRRLHLDYLGPCKEITPCDDAELSEFPLRMRDWLKNVLVQTYNNNPSQLTDKQQSRVKKMVENGKRLEAGDHSVEILRRDFVKNYKMFVYPVHWQFAQLDGTPGDQYLSHSELAPLRAPLVPMEHCTTRFFLSCDADSDAFVSLAEWATCFGVKPEDVSEDLLM